MTNELIALRTEKDSFLRETETTRRQFEQYSAELAEKNNNLRQEVRNTEKEKNNRGF